MDGRLRCGCASVGRRSPSAELVNLWREHWYTVEGVEEADGDDGRLMRRLMNRKGMQRVIMVTMSTMYKLMSALEKPRPPKKGMSKSYQMSKSLPFRGVVKKEWLKEEDLNLSNTIFAALIYA